MTVKYVKCPECPAYLSWDNQYCCTMCWGSQLVTVEEYEQYTEESYDGDHFYDLNGNILRNDFDEDYE